jgi:hypothetical protein
MAKKVEDKRRYGSSTCTWMLVLALISVLLLNINIMTTSDWGIIVGIAVGVSTILVVVIAATRWMVDRYHDYCYPWSAMTLKAAVERKEEKRKLTIDVVKPCGFYSCSVLLQIEPRNAVTIGLIKLRTTRVRNPRGFFREFCGRYRSGQLSVLWSNRVAVPSHLADVVLPRRLGYGQESPLRIANVEDVTVNLPEGQAPSLKWEIPGQFVWVVYGTPYEVPATTPIRLRLTIEATASWDGQFEFSCDVGRRRRPIRRGFAIKMKRLGYAKHTIN